MLLKQLIAVATLLSTGAAIPGRIGKTSNDNSSGSSRISYNGQCGSSHDMTCLGSDSGDCCSQYGYCGSSGAYCGIGCQSDFGSCSNVGSGEATNYGYQTQPETSSGAAHHVSDTSRCGKNGNGATCAGSEYGDCCSIYGWFGSTPDYCASYNCQKGHGIYSTTHSTLHSSIPSRLPSSPRHSTSSRTHSASKASSRVISVTSSSSSSSSLSSLTTAATSSSTSTATSSSTSTSPTCTASVDNSNCITLTAESAGGFTSSYSSDFAGCGVRTDPTTDPSNDDPVNRPTVTTSIDGTLSACAAIQQCADYAANECPGYVYLAFDIHFQISTSSWTCVQCDATAGVSDSAQFTVVDSDVGEAFGYTFGVIANGP